MLFRSKLDHMESTSRHQAQQKNLHKMVMAMTQDVRVILVKLADRLHNMRTISALPLASRKRIARETLDFYAPIALRLGMNNLYRELEDLCFEALHPMRAQCIRSAVRKTAQNRKELVEQVRRQISGALEKAELSAVVTGREKHLYSIYRKMRERHRSFSELMDVFGFRVVMQDVDSCYRALGVIHNLYKPLEARFKDFIAIPKSNGYQSLHTVLFGMYGIQVEIQIRTDAMDEMAEHGIAAHDLYKLGDDEPSVQLNQLQIRKWMQSLLELQQESGNPAEFLEHMREDLFPDEIYVFTPEGDIIKLPMGSTPVDFAYEIHTDIGNHCVGCQVDKKPAVLHTILQSGQTVEIITSPDASPHPAWIDFIATGKARSHIRHSLKQRRREDAIVLGRQLLERSLRMMDASIRDFPEKDQARLVQDSGTPDLDQLLADIGFGNRVAGLVAEKLVDISQEENSRWQQLRRYFGLGIRSRHEPLYIHGTEGVMVHFGGCCSPVPGDQITGHISAGRGLVVHESDCPNLVRSNQKRELIPLSWSEEVSGEFTARLLVEAEHSRGLTVELANLINHMDANVEHLDLRERNERMSMVSLSIGVRDRIHLARILRRLRRIKAVSRVTRQQG